MDRANKEDQLLELGDAHANFEQNIERLTIQRDNVPRDIVQAIALEAELEQIRTATEEQVNLLSKDFLYFFFISS